MTEATQTEFAKLINRSKSYVTKLKSEGRLVMTDDGKRVKVEESKQRIEDTKDPNRDDVAARHAENRGETQPDIEDIAPKAERSRIHTSRFQEAKTREQEVRADLAELELEEKRGNSFPRDVVLNVTGKAIAEIVSQLDNLEDALTTNLLGITDETVMRARIRDEVERVRYLAADELGKIATRSAEAAA